MTLSNLLIELPFSVELNGSTEAAETEREGWKHKIIFNQHLPFEHLAFH